jgi:hypothetical protein
MVEWIELDGGNVRLARGDALAVLPEVQADAFVIDPPYGIDFGRSGGFSASHGWGPWRENCEWDKERPPRDIFDAILQLGVPTVVWGGNYFTDYLPPSGKWLIWDKGQTDFSLADCEVAWCSWGGAIRRLLYPRSLALKDGKVHPTQKPLAVMEWNLRQLPPKCSTIADLFMGSGTTIIAAHRLGLSAIGVEKDPEIFATAVKRITAELNRAPLFEPAPAIQRAMFEEPTA